ncbi:hypothetical protein D918_08621 [Trichuris suis]|nr:hypothetical protein D918_08621 [Trichuris suis]
MYLYFHCKISSRLITGFPVRQDLSQVRSVVEAAIPTQEEGSTIAKEFDAELLSKVSGMPGRERTQEFNAFAMSLQMKTAASDVTQPRRQDHAKAEVGEFSQLAKKIGHDLSQTFVKLEKLTISKPLLSS